MDRYIVMLTVLLRAPFSSCFSPDKRWKPRTNTLSHATLRTLEGFKPFKVDTHLISDQYINHDHNNNHEVNSKEYEVEQKFVIPTSSGAKSVENKLKNLGFQKHSTYTFTDWYFDLPSPHWSFTPDDVWLRYREYKGKKMGEWQLKCRPEIRRYKSPATVYEELEGDDALHKTLDILSKKTYATKKIVSKEELFHKWGTYDIPYHEILSNTNLVPFAKFDTIRSSWISNDTKEYSNLKVDIDGTCFGFMVGEVEMMVTDEYRIKDASEKISAFISNVLSCTGEEDGSYYKTSKLEMYLRTQSPEHFILLLTSGVI